MCLSEKASMQFLFACKIEIVPSSSHACILNELHTEESTHARKSNVQSKSTKVLY